MVFTNKCSKGQICPFCPFIIAERRINMYVRKRNDRYVFSERYKDPLTNHYKETSITLGKNTTHSRKEAQRILEQKITDIVNEYQSGGPIQEVNLQQLCDEFMSQYKKRVRPSSYINKRTVIINFLNTIGKDALVDKVTPKILSNFLNGLLYGDHPISNGYVSKYKISLHQLFEFAKDQNYVKVNPVNEVKVNYPTSANKQTTRSKFLEQDEMKKLLNYAYQKNPRYARLCEWLYLTGMRAGEATALSPSDVKFNKSEKTWFADVTGTLEYERTAITQQRKSDSPKTEAGVRSVSLSTRAVQIYKEAVAKSGSRNFIFTTSSGTPIQISALNTFLRTAKKNLKIDKPISSHIFRHTHISKLAELGVPLYVIQKRVGHSNSRITEQIYLHVTKVVERELQNKLDKF